MGGFRLRLTVRAGTDTVHVQFIDQLSVQWRGCRVVAAILTACERQASLHLLLHFQRRKCIYVIVVIFNLIIFNHFPYLIEYKKEDLVAVLATVPGATLMVDAYRRNQ